MPSKVLFLTGAPRSDSLEWEPSVLLEDFTTQVARFANNRDSDGYPVISSVTPMESKHASWRTLDVDRRHLTTGHSQVRGVLDEYQGKAVFLAISDLPCASSYAGDASFQSDKSSSSSLGSAQEGFSQYYEQSFVTHEETASSRALLDLSSLTTQMSSSSEFDSTMTPPRPPVPNGGDICNLEDIPDAKYLESIQPRTVTFNLIVGVVSILPYRKIKTRRSAEVTLLEVVVGDETRSGFRVNFWLPSNLNKADEVLDDGSIGKILSTVRPQDILLLKNVAAAHFRGQVYGQSIRKDLTRAHLLFRNRLDRTETGGCYNVEDLEYGPNAPTQLSKVSRVRHWAQHFVSPPKLKGVLNGKTNLLKEDLPPDTQ